MKTDYYVITEAFTVKHIGEFEGWDEADEAAEAIEEIEGFNSLRVLSRDSLMKFFGEIGVTLGILFHAKV